MNYRDADWVFALKRDSTTKLVLMALLRHANPTGTCWPSMSRIAEMCGTTPRTVQRILRTLQGDGVITIESRYDKSGRQTSNCYHLAFDRDPDTLSPLAAGRVTECQGEGDTGDTPGGDTAMSPLEQPKEVKKEVRSDPVDNFDNEHESVEEMVESLPDAVMQGEKALIARMLHQVDLGYAGLLIDELKGALVCGRINKAPVNWFRAVVRSYHEGNFEPTYACFEYSRRAGYGQPEATQGREAFLQIKKQLSQDEMNNTPKRRNDAF